MGDDISFLTGKALDGVVSAVSAHFESPSVQEPIEEFMARHCGTFVEGDGLDSGEGNKFEYSTVWRQYCDLLDRLIEGFLEDQGLSVQQFFEVCKKIHNRGDEFGASARFINMLLSISDFETFVQLMQGEARTRGVTDASGGEGKAGEAKGK